MRPIQFAKEDAMLKGKQRRHVIAPVVIPTRHRARYILLITPRILRLGKFGGHALVGSIATVITAIAKRRLDDVQDRDSSRRGDGDVENIGELRYRRTEV